jgi:hypothetical protein
MNGLRAAVVELLRQPAASGKGVRPPAFAPPELGFYSPYRVTASRPCRGHSIRTATLTIPGLPLFLAFPPLSSPHPAERIHPSIKALP